MRTDWEEVSIAMLCCFTVTLVITIFLYIFSSKKHKGYYLRQIGGTHQIYINWENAPDQIAFSTYNKAEAMAIFRELKEMEKYTKRRM